MVGPAAGAPRRHPATGRRRPARGGSAGCAGLAPSPRADRAQAPPWYGRHRRRKRRSSTLGAPSVGAPRLYRGPVTGVFWLWLKVLDALRREPARIAALGPGTVSWRCGSQTGVRGPKVRGAGRPPRPAACRRAPVQSGRDRPCNPRRGRTPTSARTRFACWSDGRRPRRWPRPPEQRFLDLLENQPEAARPDNSGAHLTASTLIVSAGLDRVLLCLHGRMHRWVQVGGHCEDSDVTIAQAALREATEESGIAGLRLHPDPIDLDIHAVNCRYGPASHFDVRFAAIAPPGADGRSSVPSRGTCAGSLPTRCPRRWPVPPTA